MEILRIALVGGLVGLDTSAAFQIMLCQPLIGGFLAGWALGDPWGGAFIGLLFQGLYLVELPIGGRFFTDGHQAAVQGSASYAILHTQAAFDPGVRRVLFRSRQPSIPESVCCSLFSGRFRLRSSTDMCWFGRDAGTRNICRWWIASWRGIGAGN